jgi:hypothetical protein
MDDLPLHTIIAPTTNDIIFVTSFVDAKSEPKPIFSLKTTEISVIQLDTVSKSSIVHGFTKICEAYLREYDDDRSLLVNCK